VVADEEIRKKAGNPHSEWCRLANGKKRGGEKQGEGSQQLEAEGEHGSSRARARARADKGQRLRGC